MNRVNKDMEREIRNANTTDFETRMRAVYAIGKYSSWQAIWHKGVKKGDNRYLGGKGTTHD